MKVTSFDYDVCVVGGAGHVGLPLSIAFAANSLRVLICDVNQKALDVIASGSMPFKERDAEPLLKKVLRAQRLTLTTRPFLISECKAIVIVIGTPVDEFLNPSLKPIIKCLESITPYISDDQLLVLRSTVFPGATEIIRSYLAGLGKHPRLAYCPERIAQGKAMEELRTLPQIISGVDVASEDEAEILFASINTELLRYSVAEAELIKLFSNAYRYIQFAIANQFYMICHAAGVDYYRVLEGMRYKYPRAKSLNSAGFAAGPCLLKDTMQLSAFYNNQFTLGQSALLVNESMPYHIVEMIAKKHELSTTTVGLLGMAFKADNDDRRSSLSYKLKNLLTHRAKAVLTADPYVSDDPAILPVDDVIKQSDVLVLCAPHITYTNLDLRDKPVLDIWDFWGRV